MSQLDLPLGRPVDAREDEFLVGEANAAAIHSLEHRGAWPVMAAMIVGPRKSGRSTLARIFTRQHGGAMIDDAERASETAIFHAWNRAQSERRPLLIIADAPPPEWVVNLPDLRSRLAATPVLRIGAPDDALIADLFVHLFDRRHLDARPELIRWLTRRVERSYVAVVRVVDALEENAYLRRSARLSIPIARNILSAGPLLADPAPDSFSEDP